MPFLFYGKHEHSNIQTIKKTTQNKNTRNYFLQRTELTKYLMEIKENKENIKNYKK